MENSKLKIYLQFWIVWSEIKSPELQVLDSRPFPPSLSVPGFQSRGYSSSGDATEEPQSFGEPERLWGPQEPGVQGPQQQAGGSAVQWHSQGPAAPEGDRFH